jgi:hypothetical protein
LQAAPVPRTGVIRQFDFTLSFAAPESSLPAGVDVFRVVAAGAPAKVHRRKAKLGGHDKTAPT